MTSTTDAPAVTATGADHAADTASAAGDAPARPARPARKPRPAKRRAEGQWKLGYREPLNPNEQVKNCLLYTSPSPRD